MTCQTPQNDCHDISFVKNFISGWILVEVEQFGLGHISKGYNFSKSKNSPVFLFKTLILTFIANSKRLQQAIALCCNEVEFPLATALLTKRHQNLVTPSKPGGGAEIKVPKSLGMTLRNGVLTPVLSYTPSPWFMLLSLVRFSFVCIFKTIPKNLVHAVYPLLGRVRFTLHLCENL